MLLVAAGLVMASAPGARAGTYDVVACGGAAGATHGAFTPAADRGMTAYSFCPNTPSKVETGLVTRAVATAGPSSVPYFAGAYQIFEAPPGATLASVSLDLAAIRLATYWTTGVVAYDNDFNVGELAYGCAMGRAGCAIGTPSFFGPVTAGLRGHSKFRFETRCGAASGCDTRASGFNPGTRALFSAANVTVRVQDFTSPTIRPTEGALFGGDWLRGTSSGFSSLQDNVGVMVNRTLVDGQVTHSEDFRDPAWPAAVRCDFTRRRPCNDLGRAGSYVNTRAFGDGRHELRVEAVDAAGNAARLTRTIQVDNTAPARVNVSVAGGSGWRRSNGFALHWSTPPRQTSPIARAHYRLCPRGGTRSSCVTGRRSANGIEQITLNVPARGEYSARVWLEDEAGNASEANASDAVALRFDDAPPETADLEPLDENDPRRLEARVGDSTSAVVWGAIELRRSGYRQWHSLPTRLGSTHLSAYVDDLALADGVYEVRVRARDTAGNETAHDRHPDGRPMTLTLPLRTPTRIAVARNLHGTLATEAGRPVAFARIAVDERVRTRSDFRRAAVIETGASGRFVYRPRPGPSRTFRFRYDGTALIKPASAVARLSVAARSTLRVSRSSVRNGQSVRFSGRLAGRPLPDGGKLVDLQAYFRRRWRTFATPRTDSVGRWRYRYRFEATRGVVRYRFRALIRREAAYPYELGRSRVVRVTVRG
jgi:hypothetical protein